jgi:hypothetical protein
MSQREANQRLRQARSKFILSLVINGIVPLVVYTLVHPLLANDASALAIAGAVPAARTVTLWLWRRRVDWIGVYAIVGFAIACAAAALSGGNSFLLKVHGSLLTGTIGLVCLISVIIGQPVLLPVLQAFSQSDRTPSSGGATGSSNAASRRSSAIVTAVIGCTFLADAAAHIVLALTVPTGTFLVMSRVVTWAIIGGGAALLWWMRRRVGARSKGRASTADGD